MDPARWDRLKALFHLAIERPPAAREDLLQPAAGDDPELLSRLRGMLHAYDAEAGPLSGSGPEAVRALREELQAAIEGARIGPYEVLSEIGRGGMGAVYLARRVDGAFEAQVAIKLIKRGMDSEEIVRRFFHERRIQAGLIHPNIARLLDGGTTADGRPYFVMEHIAGRPIDRYATEEGLGVEARLRLFLVVCGAVQFAHRNLIVHRDLKPANVLVGEDGVPKLLDFGIAKLLAPDSEPGAATELGGQPMTPDYASPEQLAGRPVTTASDVYGLGLLLFELLTGAAPPGGSFGSGAGASLPGGTGLASRAARKRGEPRLARRLAGDLDTIVAKALEPEPLRRYGTASELADDLERHLRQEPVVARRPTLGYRLGRFVVRYKLATAAVLALAALTTVSVVQTFAVIRQRDRAEVERQQAEDVASFLKGLFKVADPGSSRGERVTARQVVDAAAGWLLDERAAAPHTPQWLAASLRGLTLRPATRADLLQTIGETYENLGVPQAGEPCFRRALQLYSKLSGPEAERGQARTRIHLGHLAFDRGDMAAAQASYAAVLARLRSSGREIAPEAGEPLDGLGQVAEARGAPAGAERLYRQAIAVQRRGGAALREALADSLTDLANLLEERDRAEESVPLLAEVRAIHLRLFGPDHTTAADDLSASGGLAYRQGDLGRAESDFAGALAMRRRMLGGDHPKVAIALSNLAVVQVKRGEAEAALASAHEAQAILHRMAVPATQDLADSLINLVEAARGGGGKKDEVLALYREALRVTGETYGTQHPRMGKLLCNFGLAQRDFGDLAEAERLIRRSLEIRSRQSGGEGSEAAISWNALGTVLRRGRRLEAAEAAFRRALALRQRWFPPGHLDISSSQVGLGEVLLERGRAAEAHPLFASALAIRREHLATGDLKIGYAAAGLGEACLALGRQAEARRFLEEGEGILRSRLGAGSPEVERVASLRARAGRS